jgi:hypothetical protein
MQCDAALNIKGEFFKCEEEVGHLFAHSSKAAQAIWASSIELEQMDRLLAEMRKLGL